jgi:hypothetical protein
MVVLAGEDLLLALLGLGQLLVQPVGAILGVVHG